MTFEKSLYDLFIKQAMKQNIVTINVLKKRLNIGFTSFKPIFILIDIKAENKAESKPKITHISNHQLYDLQIWAFYLIFIL